MSKELVMAQEFLRRLEKLEERVFPKNDEAVAKWEYLIEKWTREPITTKKLNELGSAGWELIIIIDRPTHVAVGIFKRPQI